MSSEQRGALLRRKDGTFVMSGEHVTDTIIVIAALRILRHRFRRGDRSLGPFVFVRDTDGLNDGAVVAYLKSGQYVEPRQPRPRSVKQRCAGALCKVLDIFL